MKKLVLIFVLSALLGAAFAAEYVIGSGTGIQARVPMSGANDFGWSKMIYTKAEINTAGLNAAGSIIGIGFNVENLPINYTFRSQSVFIRHTTAQTYTLTNEPLPDSTAFALVFRGNVTFHGAGWLQVAFSTPFSWDNSRSIEILWKNFDGSRLDGYPQFKFTTTSSIYRAVYNQSDVTFPTSYGTRFYNRPNIQFITPMLPNPASVVYPSDAGWGLPNSSLAWRNSGGCPSTYDVYFGTANPPTTQVSNDQLATSYTPVLAPNTTYYWKVVPQNASGNPSNCPVWSFRTPATSRLIESFESTYFPPYDWLNPGAFTQSPNFPFHGNKNLYIATGTTARLIGTPLLSIASGDQLIFSARDYYDYGFARIRVKYSADGTAWTTLGSALALPANTSWNSYAIDLSALAGNNYRLGIEVYSANSSESAYVYLDQFIAPPLAGQILAPELGISLQGTNIRLNWTAVSGATGYKIFASDDPYSWTATPLATVGSGILTYALTQQATKFFRVLAFSE